MNEMMMMVMLGVIALAGLVVAFVAFKNDGPSKTSSEDSSGDTFTAPSKQSSSMRVEPKASTPATPPPSSTEHDISSQAEPPPASDSEIKFELKTTFPETGGSMSSNTSLAEYDMNIGLNIFLAIITCGLYNIFWNYKQMKVCNLLLERNEFTFWHWLVFSPLTCGIYHVIYQYKMGEAILEVQDKKNTARKFKNLPIMSCLLTIIGLSIVMDGIHQNEINKLIR